MKLRYINIDALMYLNILFILRDIAVLRSRPICPRARPLDLQSDLRFPFFPVKNWLILLPATPISPKNPIFSKTALDFFDPTVHVYRFSFCASCAMNASMRTHMRVQQGHSSAIQEHPRAPTSGPTFYMYLRCKDAVCSQ